MFNCSIVCIRNNRVTHTLVDLAFQTIAVKKTHLEFKEIHTKDETMKHTVKEVTKRNDTHLSNHQRFQLQGWRANCNIQVIIDYHSCLE